MSPTASHQKRQINNDPNSPYYCPSWYCDEQAYIIKWAVVGGICFVIVAFFLIGYIHAQRRMKKGLAPLRYHRWMLSRHARERFFPTHQNPHAYYQQPSYIPSGHNNNNNQYQTYPMHNYGYAPPPPAYHEAEAVPVYTPPTKVNPDQSYAPPPGGPPQVYNSMPAAGSSSVYSSEPARPDRSAGGLRDYVQRK